jgi:pimeloyl-ACP methyl ester carboxylesterase
MKPAPFLINVERGVLADLRQRLGRTHWTHGPRDDTWDFGTSPSYLKELLAYWRNRFEWHEVERSLNQFAQFKAEVGGASIHFIHEQAHGQARLPLLLLHGWPDSFYRYYKVVPRLTAPADHDAAVLSAFDVVVPSLPGFGFTGPVKHRSSEQPNRQSAELLWRLMTEVLGYRRFAVAGGDGGSVLAQIMAIDHPESVVGIHLTDLGWHAANIDPSTASKAEQKYLEAGKKQFMADGAYAAVQASTPNSLAPALLDSPSGLAAWILDRFHSWSGHGSELENSFSKDELLTNIMIYWVTRTIGSSIETYRADTLSPSLTPADHVDVPVGLALFPDDIGGVPPRELAERTLNVQHWSEMPSGSHLAALEEPELYARDVATFLHTLAA